MARLFAKELDFLAAAPRRRMVAPGSGRRHERVTAPLVTYSALARALDDFPQRGLLGEDEAEERVYFNANTPSSGVICGVQGAGKSHTVSCILENALLQDERIGNLPQPLAALVFHFDEQDGDRACEAAYLSMPSQHFDDGAHVRRVTVLASPSNLNGRRRAYRSLPNVNVQPLYLAESDLTASRMLALMGWSEANIEAMPLYMHTVMQILRDMGNDGFNYSEFKRQLELQQFDMKQKLMLGHRLRLLDGFLAPGRSSLSQYFGCGAMVLVDLTDPFMDGLMASVLFDIVLGSFMGWKSATGKIVVLDEAHKYLTNSDSARLNKSIASIIRQQRHLATRVIIATQEPTVIPATILDLASFVICHRFTSPSWCSHLARHVSTGTDSWFEDVMRLATGEGLVFSPSSLTMPEDEEEEDAEPVLLGKDYLRVHVRPRLTRDGGASLMAVALDGVGSALDAIDQEENSSRPGTPVADYSPVSWTPAPPLPQPLPTLRQVFAAVPLTPKLTSDGGASLLAASHVGLEPAPHAASPDSSRPPSTPPPRPQYIPHVAAVSKPVPLTPRPSPPAASQKLKPKAVAKRQVDPRFKPLVTVLQRHSGSQVNFSQVAEAPELNHLRRSKNWFKAYIQEAKAGGVVRTGKGKGDELWVELVES
ncbi:hypothetical protein EXIGLDRAFT_648219 [Exidia glandulosa HHB12029]|uniref:AAA+ ATPase domain-containing protein n=1 Tax=Exidia glandulosa HHB12029 TaxID=1314781 RepID=A0A165H645_EXIGL|nr:hypothetical protein EXIGLDRAFT_648219 [Exidia glandulosa HHB12029]